MTTNDIPSGWASIRRGFLSRFRWVVLLVAGFGGLAGAQVPVGRIQIPGRDLGGVLVHAPTGRVCVYNATDAKVHLFDVLTLGEVATVSDVGYMNQMLLHQGTGRLFLGSMSGKKITVVDVPSARVVGQIPTTQYHLMAVDEGANRLLVLDEDHLQRIDVNTLAADYLDGIPLNIFYMDMAVNPVTHELFIGNALSGYLEVVDILSFARSSLTYDGVRSCGPAVGINPVHNKVCISTGMGVHVPFILFDRPAGTSKLLYADNDNLRFFYNPAMDALFTSVEVNNVCTILRGADDTFFNLPMEGPVLSLSFSPSTGHVYFAGGSYLGFYDPSSEFLELIPPEGTPTGGAAGFEAAVHAEPPPVEAPPSPSAPAADPPELDLDPVTGRVFFLRNNAVHVFQDTDTPVRPPLIILDSHYSIWDPVSRTQRSTRTGSEGFGDGAAVRPGTGRIYVPEKAWGRVGVYAGCGPYARIGFLPCGGQGPSTLAFAPDGSRLYVVNENSDSVGVIDPDQGVVLAAIPVGDLPAGIAVHPDGTRVYVANNWGRSVSVIDTRSLSVVATISTAPPSQPYSGYPRGVAVTRGGARVLVVNENPSSLVVIDTKTNTKLSHVSLGGNSSSLHPSWIALTPDGETAYITNLASNTVSVVDVVGLSLKSTLPVGTNPTHLVVLPDGREVWVYNENYAGLPSLSIIRHPEGTVTPLTPYTNHWIGEGFAAPDPFSRVQGLVETAQGPATAAGVRLVPRVGDIRTVNTDLRGEYALAGLPVGAGDVRVTLPGFTPRNHFDLTLGLGRTLFFHDTLSAQPLPGDLDETGVVGLADLVLMDLYLAGSLTPGQGRFTAPLSTGDLNGDGVLNGVDRGLLADRLGAAGN